MVRFFCLSSVVALLFFSQSAVAATQTYSDSIPTQGTDWADNLVVPLFNPSLGTLTQVQIVLNGDVGGSAGYENTSTTSTSSVTLNLSSTIVLTGPNSLLIDVVPLANFSIPAVPGVPIYDGFSDYAGTSGATLTNLTGSAMDMDTITNPGDLLAYYTGLGTISFPVTATGSSLGGGSGNINTSFSSTAGASIEITYTYDVAIPEPSSVAIVGLGIIGTLAARRFRYVA